MINIKFIKMKMNFNSKVKTVNLDQDIFKQNFTFAKSKPPIHKLKMNDQRKRSKSINHRSLTQRINRNSMCNIYQPQQEVDVFGRVQNKQCDKQLAEKDYVFSKKHVKTNISNQKYFFRNQQVYALKRYTPIFGGFFEGINDQQILKEKHNSPKQQLFEIHQNEVNKIYNKLNLNEQSKPIVNPYTKDQYIYMKNKREDQLKYLQKQSKMERISSIMKSYKISPISLIPQTHKRTNSMKISTSNNKRCSAYSPVKKESILTPSPWQWGTSEYSKDDVP